MNTVLALMNLVVSFSLNEGANVPQKARRRVLDDQLVLGRCVDCANNAENWKDTDYRDPARSCINDGHGLACAQKGLHWICALSDELKKGLCHETYTYELWCNMADRKKPICDGREKYEAKGGDGRIGVKDTYVGPDGKFNWYDKNVKIKDMSKYLLKG